MTIPMIELHLFFDRTPNRKYIECIYTCLKLKNMFKRENYY